MPASATTPGQLALTSAVLRSIDEVDGAAWDSLLRRDGDTFMDRRFIRAIERTMSDRAEFRYILIHDECGQPLAAACAYFYRLAAYLPLRGRWRRAVQWMHRAAPRLLQFKAVICGLPFPSGDSHLRMAPQADPAAVLRCLDAVLARFAREKRTRLVAFREFDEEGCRQADPLRSLGYRRRASYPMNYFRTECRDFDSYVAGFRPKCRRNVNRSRRKFQSSGLRVVHRNGREGLDRLYTADVHRLFDAVADGKPTVDLIPPSFYPELARQMPDETVFTFVERDGRIVGFNATLCGAGVCRLLSIGYDHELNGSVDLYFNLLFHSVDRALKGGQTHVFLGQTCDELKEEKFAARQTPLFGFARFIAWHRSTPAT